MARVPVKRLIVIDIMNSNAHLAMADVVPLIQNHEGVACSPNQAKAWYKWIVERKMAAGVVEAKRKAPASTAKTTLEVVSEAANEIIEGTPEEEMTEEEVAAIRSANAEKILAAVKANAE